MKTILFFTTPSEHSPEKLLWPWKSDEQSPCNVLLFTSLPSEKYKWQVFAYKVLGCDKLYRHGEEWQYEQLKSIIKEHDKDGEFAVFMHTDEGRLSGLKKKLSEEEKEQITFLNYSSQSTFFPHIESFAQSPTETTFNRLWDEQVETKKKEAVIKKLCQLRYDILIPLVVWDLLCTLDSNNLQDLAKHKKAIVGSCKSERKLTIMRDNFLKHFADRSKYASLVGNVNLISNNYNKVRKNEKTEDLPRLINDFNQAIEDKRIEKSA